MVYLLSIEPKSPRTTGDNAMKFAPSSIDAEHQHIDALEDSMNKRIKAIEEALRSGQASLGNLEEELQKRMDNRAKTQNENKTFVSRDVKEINDSKYQMELMRQRKPFDDLKKNVNTVFLQLLNQTGIGE